MTGATDRASAEALISIDVRPGRDYDRALLEELADLVNEAYRAASVGLWEDGFRFCRTDADRLATLARQGTLVTARLDGRLVGCIQFEELDGGLGQLHMLAAAEDCQGLGVGRELMRFAERTAAERGVRVMQLEALDPRGRPLQQRLLAWYQRLGYDPVGRRPVTESWGDDASHLAQPCDEVICRKRLDPAT